MSPILLPVSHIQQQNMGDCLAACVAMTLSYMDITIPYTKILKTLRVEWFGTPFSNIMALEKLGITVLLKTGNLAELHSHLLYNRPCIVFVQTGDLPYWQEVTTHAVVVSGIDANYVYLNDPAFIQAPLRVTLGDFDLAWLEQGEIFATFL